MYSRPSKTISPRQLLVVVKSGFTDVEHVPMALTNTNSFLRAWKR